MAVGKILFSLVFLVAIAAIFISYFSPEIELPKTEDAWFGLRKLKKGESIPKDPIKINKFSVNVAETVLDDLRKRIANTRYIESIEGTNFNYGFNSNYLKQVIEYWKTKYDWRKQEKELNKYDNFKTQIAGIDIHFVHVKPTKPAKKVLPLLMIHGWPGSFIEFYKSIPLLTEPVDGVAFEVIVPSLPGYGFSEAPHQEGCDTIATARIFVKLMERLGHKKFYVHGGDWGSLVARMLAVFYPENVSGMHTTMSGMLKLRGMGAVKFFVGMFAPSLVFDDPVRDYDKLYPFLDKFYTLIRETGFMHLQATKPDTLGTLLHDSPVGLAAYILEKFSTWTNPNNVNKPDGGLTEKFTLDELLTNVMIYWVNSPVSSVRYYKENLNYKMVIELGIEKLYRFPIKETVPAAVANLPHELLRVPKALTKYEYHNLVQYTDMPRGGHFSAFEEPKLVVDDIRKFVNTVLQLEASKDNEKMKA